MIRTRSLSKSYRSTPVLRGVDLDVEGGTIHGFVGPNGAGKSTLLKCLVGVVHPDDGEITIDGLDVRSNALAVRRRVGYAPAETTLYHRMKSSELLDFAIRYHPSPDHERARHLMEGFGVPGNRRVGALSHGMKRKLLLVQAIACNAPLMILDEPMEALDPEARRIAEDLLKAEVERGRTIFLSSHDLFSTQRLCSRVTFLHHGKVLRDGPVDELLADLSGQLNIQFRDELAADQLPSNPAFKWTGSGLHWKVQFSCPLEELMAELCSLPIAGLRDDRANLEELFDHLYKKEAEQ